MVVNHTWRAVQRFTDVLGGRLAGAVSYFGFFATYALGVLAYSIVGRLLDPDEAGVLRAANQYLESNLPWIAPIANEVRRGDVTVLAGAALLLAGIGWVEALRSSLRAVWLLDQQPGNWLLRRLVDLGALVGLGLLFAGSLATTALINTLTQSLTPGSRTVVAVCSHLLELLVNLVLATAVLTALSRIRMSLRRLLPAALVTALGIQLLNTVGRLLIARTENRPAFTAVVGPVGLLTYLYLLNQILLFGAALAATARSGTAIDLGRGVAGIHPRGKPIARHPD
nr:YhjD/YihY/BrkB family envelope integrity protein [Micromonospora tarapacensis]